MASAAARAEVKRCGRHVVGPGLEAQLRDLPQFHLTLDYEDYDDNDDLPSSSPPPPASSSPSTSASSTPTASSSPTATCNGDLCLRIELDWSAEDKEDQVALSLQSQLMVALHLPHDAVSVDLTSRNAGEDREWGLRSQDW